MQQCAEGIQEFSLSKNHLRDVLRLSSTNPARLITRSSVWEECFRAALPAPQQYLVCPDFTAFKKQGSEIVTYLNELSASTMQMQLPGHDRRHISLLTPATAIATMSSGIAISSWALLSVLAHDLGRIPAAFTDCPSERKQLEAAHAKIGAMIFHGILQSYSLPDELVIPLTMAVLEHDLTSKCYSDVSYFVRQIDRLQLIGTEGLIRMLTCDITPTPTTFGYPLEDRFHHDIGDLDSVKLESLPRKIEFALRHLVSPDDHPYSLVTEQLKLDSVAFLKAILSESELNVLFHPEINFKKEPKNGKQNLSIYYFGAGQSEQPGNSSVTVTDCVRSILQVAHARLAVPSDPEYVEKLHTTLSQIDQERLSKVHAAFTDALHRQRKMELYFQNICETTASFCKDPILNTAARNLAYYLC